jgi:hypothetical protein
MDYQQLEQARLAVRDKQKKIRDIVLKIYFGVIAVAAVLSIFSLSNDISLRFSDVFMALVFPAIQFSIFALVGYIVASAIATSKEQKAYRDAYKSHFVTETLNKVFTDLTYAHDAAMPRSIIADTRMMNMGDTYGSNDYVIAKYKGIPFKQADVHIQEQHTDSDGDTTYVTIFRGRWITFDFNKKFEKRLLVEGKHFGCACISRSDKFQKIQLESIEFSRNFNVRAQDGFEAYYLLDPAVMERIQKLSDLHNGRVMVCFADNKMHIGINNNIDSFEPPSVKNPIDEKHEFNKVINDIKVITNIVDELKLVK